MSLKIKAHIPTEPFGFVEMEFESQEDFVKNYAKILGDVRFQQYTGDCIGRAMIEREKDPDEEETQNN